MYRTPLILVLASFTTSCMPISLTPIGVKDVGEAPEVQRRNSVAVGEVVYETYNYEVQDGARLGEAVEIDVLAAAATMAAGEFLPAFRTASHTLYCTRGPALRVTGAPHLQSVVCLADLNNDRKFDNWLAPTGPPIRQDLAPLPGRKTVAFTREKSSAPTSAGFRYELLYQGISGNVLNLLYREFNDDFARPAFQQSLNYTLATEGATDISFRSLRMRVWSADNNRIEYELLAGLAK